MVIVTWGVLFEIGILGCCFVNCYVIYFVGWATMFLGLMLILASVF